MSFLLKGVNVLGKIKLNKMQQIAVEAYADFYKYPQRRRRPWFEINGPAGTGKTTVVREAMDYLGVDQKLVAYMAFVGKATLALRMTGLNARTIHSTIYELVMTYAKDEFGDYIYDRGGTRKLIQTFMLREQLDHPFQQFVVDEGGMVGEKMGQDLLSFGVPTMVLGDLAQLPPVMAKRIFLEDPDVTLNEIMRQAADSPIIYLSQRAKNNLPIKYGIYGDHECIVIHRNELMDEHLQEADIIICETNAMRDTINEYVRRNIQHIYDKQIVPKDKLICRQNKWMITLDEDIALVNGLIGYVENVYRESRTSGCMMDIDFRPEFLQNKMFRRLNINHRYPFLDYADRQNINPMTQKNILFEFGNCITCHLSQGSQYDTVLVYVEHGGNSLYFRQWLYTAITRAKKKLILVI